jgi:hypothetical protein
LDILRAKAAFGDPTGRSQVPGRIIRDFSDISWLNSNPSAKSKVAGLRRFEQKPERDLSLSY